MQLDTETSLFLRELTHFSLSTRMTPCNVLFSPSSHFKHSFVFPLTSRGGALSIRGLQTIVFPCFTSHAVLPSVKKKNKKRWGDIWVTAGCEVEHQTPPERLESARGRDVMMCQPASHHVWLPARRRSPAKPVYIIDRMKNSNLSQMQSAHLDTMGAIYAWCFHQRSSHSSMQWGDF